MRRQVDPQLVGGISFVVPGAGLAYMGLWGWAVAAFVAEVALIRLIGVPSGHPVIVWFVLAIICSGATTAFAKYHPVPMPTLVDDDDPIGPGGFITPPSSSGAAGAPNP